MTKLILVMILITAVPCILTQFNDQEAAIEKGRQEIAEQARLDAMNPEQRAQEEKKAEERRTAEEIAEIHRLGLKWSYKNTEDPMGRGAIKTASVKSINVVRFGWPYSGGQRATLQLRQHPKHGNDVMLSIEQGQFLCNSSKCNVDVRFGNGTPVLFEGSEPSDHGSTVIFLMNYERFVSEMKKVERVSVEVPFFQEGNRVFEFHVADLQW